MVDCYMAESREQIVTHSEEASQRAWTPDSSHPSNEGSPQAERTRQTGEKRWEIESKLTELLKMISHETAQLTNSIVEEKKLTNELCGLLSQILSRLKISFNVPPGYISNLEKATQIRVNEEGRLIAIASDSGHFKYLENYPTDTIMTVLLTIIPGLEEAIKAHRKTVSHRVSLLEKARLELKNLQKAFSPDQNGASEPVQEEARKPSNTSRV
jgi:hypothetical protein